MNPAPSSPKRRAGKREVTLKDVAAHAGVGPITVSRALREPDKVSPALRQRIAAAVAELGYLANPIASGMASGRSRMVPVIVPTLGHAVYVPFLRGVHEVLEPQGHEVLLGSSEYREQTELRLVEGMLGWSPVGLMLAGVDHAPALRQRLRALATRGTPVIEFMDLDGEPIDLMVGFSHRAVGDAAARWLAGLGHQRIAFAGTLPDLDLRARRRAEGFVAALSGLGLPPPLQVWSQAPFSIGLGGRLLAEVIERDRRVQAVFFANDDLAAGALFEAQRRGLAVPADLALLGFNDTEIAAEVHPALSSVAVDRLAMGRSAAQLLLQRLAGHTPVQAVVDTGFSIVARASTAAPPRPLSREIA